MEGLYILSLKEAVQSTSRTVPKLDAFELLPQHMDFVLLQEAKRQLAKSLRKIPSTLIFLPQVSLAPLRKGQTRTSERELRFRFSLIQS